MKTKGSRGGNPNPCPEHRFKKGDPNIPHGGRKALQRREGDNRHDVLNAWDEIAKMPASKKLTEKDLEKKTKLWAGLYNLYLKDFKTWLAYGAGLPRQAIDLDGNVSGKMSVLVKYDKSKPDSPYSVPNGKTN